MFELQTCFKLYIIYLFVHVLCLWTHQSSQPLHRFYLILGEILFWVGTHQNTFVYRILLCRINNGY